MVEQSRYTGDDPALLDRFRGGDPAAFDKLVTRHRRTVYLAARRLLGTHEDADEAAQQALVRAWRARSQFRGDAALRTWLIRIVLNVGKSMIAAKTQQPQPVDEIAELRDPSEDAEQGVSREQARESVRRAVVALPPRQREVVLLKVFSEMTYKEVAEALQLSEGSVKAHLHQAVSNLRRSMRPQEVREVAR